MVEFVSSAVHDVGVRNNNNNNNNYRINGVKRTA